jgi:hypothetical protein
VLPGDLGADAQNGLVQTSGRWLVGGQSGARYHPFSKHLMSTMATRRRDPHPQPPPGFENEARPKPSGQADKTANTQDVQINTVGLSDSPAKEDLLGFQPYVRAIGWFLLNPKTLPPLTISIEGPWGTGKSSFMKQIQSMMEEEVQGQGADDLKGTGKKYFVTFNAWRADKDEALWAAFALTFMKQLGAKIGFWRRISANFSLQLHRIDWRRGKSRIALWVVFVFATIGLTVLAMVHVGPVVLGAAKSATPADGVIGVSWLATLGAALHKTWGLFRNPLSRDIDKYIQNPRYEDKVAFIEDFQNDFSDIVQSYVGKIGRVYAFIDDLDRCEIPRAADLMQAINLLLSAESGNLVFILGLDREMVAAGLAAKYEKLLPYLAESQSRNFGRNHTTARVGVDYGYNFLQKFIQVPFQVPRPTDIAVERWVSNLLGTANLHPDLHAELEVHPPEHYRPFRLLSGVDPEGFEEIVMSVSSRIFRSNPRQIKQFINVLRLHVLIALQTGVLAPSYSAMASSTGERDRLSLRELGFATAIILRWPTILPDLIERPTLLSELTNLSGVPKGARNTNDDRVVAEWLDHDDLIAALCPHGTYETGPLSGVDIRPLLSVLPNMYLGGLAAADRSAQVTSLVPGSFGALPRGPASFPGVPPSPGGSTTPTGPGPPPSTSAVSGEARRR